MASLERCARAAMTTTTTTTTTAAAAARDRVASRRVAASRRPRSLSSHGRSTTPARATTTLARATAAEYDALWSWLESNGADVSKVEPYEASASGEDEDAMDMGWGVRAREALSSGARAIVVPRKLWMTPETGKSDAELGRALTDEAFGLATWTTLALTLLKERERGPRSTFAAYVETLPETLHAPLFWSAEELGEIQGTQLLDNAAGYDGYLRGVYEELRDGLFAKYPDIFDVDGAFDESSFRWAFGILRSRTMAPLEGANITLVPGIDLINHSSLSESVWKVGDGGVAGAVAGFFGNAGGADGVSARVDCDRALKEKEPLWVNYIPGGIDSSFALDFGFVDAATPSPGYSLALSVPEDDVNYYDKLDVLDVCGLGENPTFTLRAYKNPSPELRTFLRLLNCQGQDAFLLEALFRQDCWNLISDPLSRENEAACCESIVLGVSDALSRFATRTTDDERTYLTTPHAQRVADAPSKSTAIRREIATRVRLAEKSTLTDVGGFFDSLAASLDELEYYQERRLRSLNLLDDDGKSTYDPFDETMA